MPKISIQTLRYDEEDEIIIFRMSFSNEFLNSSLDFYGDDLIFKSFAKELIDFPQSIDHIAHFQIGEDNAKWAYFLSLKAICVEPNGKSILRILVDNHGDIECGYRIEFSIGVEIAEINRFGQSLFNWVPEEGNELAWK